MASDTATIVGIGAVGLATLYLLNQRNNASGESDSQAVGGPSGEGGGGPGLTFAPFTPIGEDGFFEPGLTPDGQENTRPGFGSEFSAGLFDPFGLGAALQFGGILGAGALAGRALRGGSGRTRGARGAATTTPKPATAPRTTQTTLARTATQTTQATTRASRFRGAAGAVTRVANTPAARIAGRSLAVVGAVPTAASAVRTVDALRDGDQERAETQSSRTFQRGVQFLSLGAANVNLQKGSFKLFGREVGHHLR